MRMAAGLVMFWLMKTKLTFTVAALAALAIAGIAGCDTSGPLTRAVTLSSLKTFDVVATTKDQPAPVADAVREEVQSKGYQPQAVAPDFIVYAGWDSTQTITPAGQAGPPDTKVGMVQLSIVVRNRVTNEVLWRNPSTDPVLPDSLTADTAKGMVKAAMKDFPPSQTTM